MSLECKHHFLTKPYLNQIEVVKATSKAAKIEKNYVIPIKIK